MKKNKLIISTEQLENGALRYKLHDNNIIYLLSQNLDLVNRTAETLKAEYNREKQNASKV